MQNIILSIFVLHLLFKISAVSEIYLENRFFAAIFQNGAHFRSEFEVALHHILISIFLVNENAKLNASITIRAFLTVCCPTIDSSHSSSPLVRVWWRATTNGKNFKFKTS